MLLRRIILRVSFSGPSASILLHKSLDFGQFLVPVVLSIPLSAYVGTHKMNRVSGRKGTTSGSTMSFWNYTLSSHLQLTSLLCALETMVTSSHSTGKKINCMLMPLFKGMCIPTLLFVPIPMYLRPFSFLSHLHRV